MIKAELLTAEQHGIDVNDISQNAKAVVQTLQEAGFTAYLVGGCVRDLMLHQKPKDFDVATEATPQEVKKLFRNSRIIGRRFKLVHIRFGYEVIEVATFRASGDDRDDVGEHEMSEGEEGQLLRDNVFGTIEEDVVRRDFTVNALYYDPVADQVLDFMDSVADVKKGYLRSIGDTEKRFIEDPVRMLRIIRFAAKLDFDMQPEALDVINEQGKLLGHVSPARLFEEVLKLFHGGAAYKTYLMLREYGLFKYLFPFTEQSIVDGVEGMPDRALQNTDKRVQQDKPVIPAFLFACMMWDPVRLDARVLMDDGTPEQQAWRIAMNDALRDQNQYVAVPRRLAEIILDIWNIHFRLVKRNPRMVRACLGNRRFRAAFDFLLLRCDLHEVDSDVAEWWTRIQTLDREEQEDMIVALGKQYKSSGRAHRDDNSGNSVNYQQRNQDNYGNSKGGYLRNKKAKPQHRSRNQGGKANHFRKRRQANPGFNNERDNERANDGNYRNDESSSPRRQSKTVKVRRKRRVSPQNGAEQADSGKQSVN